MARQLTSIILLFTPALVLNALRFVVTPLQEMLRISTNLDIALHVICFGIGFMLFRKTRVVRDHEWQRSKAVKSVSGHFKAEEQGVWEQDLQMDTNLSIEAQTNLEGQVSNVVGSSNNLSPKEIDSKVEVEMLIDTSHVMKAQARVSGEEQFEDSQKDSTIGAVRKNSPMDSVIDWLASLFGKDSKQQREENRRAKLQLRSDNNPVIAQRPIAPIEPIKSEAKRPRPMEMVSMTDAGVESIIINEETNEISEPVIKSMSIEEMAFGASAKTTSNTKQTNLSQNIQCSVCGKHNPVGERFCSNCGSNL